MGREEMFVNRYLSLVLCAHAEGGPQIAHIDILLYTGNEMLIVQCKFNSQLFSREGLQRGFEQSEQPEQPYKAW